VVPVFGWASWPVKEIVAPGLSSKQTRLRELVGRKRAVRSSVFIPGRHRMTHKRGSCIRRFLSSCGRAREVAAGRRYRRMTVLPRVGSPAW
jgi:hypothetical protein